MKPAKTGRKFEEATVSFKAYLINQEEGKVVSRFVDMDDSQLDPGEVTVAVTHSSINYKDALAATGAGRIIRRFPCIGGIDLAGRVTASADPRFKAGDEILATSYDIGVAHHGGFAELARLPADWVVKLPAGLSLRDAMALGTAAGGRAVIKTLGQRLSHLRPIEGASAEFSASLVLEGAAALGVPVSTTHTITGSIIGVGSAKRMKAVKWSITVKILYAWLFTLPVTALISAALARLIVVWVK